MKDALMEYETIDADQVDDLMNRRKVRPPKQWDDNDFDSKSGGGRAEKESATKDEGPIGGPVEDI
jgi:cell division protease FtsH